MNEAPLAARLAPPRHDESARQEFVSALRKHVMTELAGQMRRAYEETALPAFRRQQGREPRDGHEVRQLMREHPAFRTWSSLRYNAQEMTWASVQDQVERHLPAINESAREAAARGPGSLRLDPALDVPEDVTRMDIHSLRIRSGRRLAGGGLRARYRGVRGRAAFQPPGQRGLVGREIHRDALSAIPAAAHSRPGLHRGQQYAALRAGVPGGRGPRN